jgi:hypothetical protein
MSTQVLPQIKAYVYWFRDLLWKPKYAPRRLSFISDQGTLNTLKKIITAPNAWGMMVQCIIAGVFGTMLSLAIIIASRSDSMKTFVLVIGLMGLPFVALVFKQLRDIMLVMLPLDMTFSIDSYLYHQEELEAVGAIGGQIIGIATICLAGLYVIWLVDFLTQRGFHARFSLYVSILHFMYFAVVALSYTVAQNRLLATFEIGLQFQSLLMFTYIASTVRTKREVLLLIVVMLTLLMIEGVMMLFVRVKGSSLELGPLKFLYREDDQRVSGSLGSPNSAASFCAFYAVFALASLLMLPGKKYKWLATGALVFGFIGVVVTQSRGGLIVFAMSSALMFAGGVFRKWVSPKIPIISIFVAVLVVVAFPNLVLARFGKDDGGSLDSRGPLNQIAHQVIDDYPTLGIGANNFAYVLPNYIKPQFADAWIYVVHNRYNLIWAETGIIGLGSFLIYLFATIYQGFLSLFNKDIDPVFGLISFGMAAGMFGLLYHMQYDIYASRVQIQNFWFIPALMIAINNIDYKNEKPGYSWR